ncbi:MAG: PAS domain S-box protein [Methanomicrobiales archaeon]|nr:PAS domain S-box protein [Methanomicrobiales archaeon]
MSTIIFDLLIAMLFISGISMAAVGLYARRFVDRVPAATPFILLMFMAMAWSILYALDLLSPTLSERIAFHNLRFLFLPFFSVLEVWLVLAYVKKTTWIRQDLAAAALAIPVTAVFLALTSPWHTLFRYNFSLGRAGTVPVLTYTEGPAFFVYNLYSFALLGIAIILLVHETRKQGTLWEMPTILLLIALAFPTVVNYLFVSAPFGFAGINPAPAFLWIAALLYAIALFRYRFLDIIPIARSRLIDALGQPVIVLDISRRVIDLNPAAAGIFALPQASALGKTMEEIVPAWPELQVLCKETASGKQEIIRRDKGRVLFFIGSVEPLLTHGGQPEGYLVFLEDVTSLRVTQDKLQKKTAELGERVKELRCLYEVARIIETGPTLDAILKGIADVIPSGWQYPSLTFARIRIDNRTYTSPGFSESSAKIGSVISINQKPYGEIEVFYAGERKSAKIAPFLEEESDLLNAIAERIGRMYERIRAEEALAQSEEKFRLFITLAPLALGVVNRSGNITFINNQFIRTFGYTHDEIPTLDDWSRRAYPDEEYRTTVLSAWNHAVATAEAKRTAVEPAEYRITCRDGTVRNIIIGGITIGESHLATFFDITERRVAEKALRESEEKYRSIIEEMQDLFYRTDTSGKITMLSPSAAAIAGYDSIDQLIGQPVTCVYADPADRDRLLTALQEKGSVDSFPLTLKTRSGEIRYVTTSSHFYRDAGGKIAGVEGVLHDITPQRKAEDALRMANKKLHLLSSVTRHDIRNQLMALMAFLELATEAIDNPRELEEFLKKNQRIASTISDQISFTKEYEDLGIKDPAWQDVSTGIEKAVSGLPVKDIRIERETAGLEIFADPLVEKVFYNLIDNSLRYGGEGMTWIRIVTRRNGNSLALVFEDNGKGVAERDKKVIFEKGVGNNTGMGLYLSREILSITGLTITETGAPGSGARFEITIPPGAFRFAGQPA